jgi:malonyl CoA-acyl carrier protein transacylase
MHIAGASHRSRTGCSRKKRSLPFNTFTREWEFEDYIKLAKQNGYRVHSIIVENRHDGKSVHGVPDETIQKMKDRFEVKL